MAGDDVAFKVIYNKYFPKLYYFIFEFITENIVHDTFATLWEKRHTLKENLTLSSYLYSLAKNNCLYRLRESTTEVDALIDRDLTYAITNFPEMDETANESRLNKDAVLEQNPGYEVD